jgi:Ca2+-binding EF-hand superfamily protein
MRTHLLLAALLAMSTPVLAQITEAPVPPPMEDGAGPARDPSKGPKKPPRDHGAAFDRLDADANGAIDSDEMAGATAKMGERGGKLAPKLFEGADANKDGSVTRAEWDAARARFEAERPKPGAMAERAFTEMDTSGDGALSLDEFKAGMERMRERHGAKGEGRGEERPKTKR